MNDERTDCQAFDEKLVRYVDGELAEPDVEELRRHLTQCTRCQEELRTHQKLRDLARDLWRIEPPEELWDEYVQGVYGRMERGLGWVLLIVGAVALILVGLWYYVTDFLLDPSQGLGEKVGVTALIAGLVVLFLSVCRSRRREARTDRYREVIR